VISSGESIRNDPSQRQLQQELAALSANSVQRVVRDADHFGLVTKEEFASDVVRSIRDVVAATRSGEAMSELNRRSATSDGPPSESTERSDGHHAAQAG
jgi:hypothetical protein